VGITSTGISALSSLARLEELDLTSCAVEDTAIAAISRACRFLTSLHLHGCSRITDAALIAIGTSELRHLRGARAGMWRGREGDCSD